MTLKTNSLKDTKFLEEFVEDIENPLSVNPLSGYDENAIAFFCRIYDTT